MESLSLSPYIRYTRTLTHITFPGVCFFLPFSFSLFLLFITRNTNPPPPCN